MKKGIGPQGLGASKSPAKMYGAKSPAKQTKAAERPMGPLDKTNPHKPGSAESEKYRRDYNTQFYDARAGKLEAGMKPPGVSKTKSPAKKFVVEPVTETAQKKMKDDQAKSNASLVKPGFGVKKPKANIK